MAERDRCGLVVTLGRPHERPWWWEDLERNGCADDLAYERLTFKDKLSQQISVLETPLFMLKVLRRLLRWRKSHEYVFTFECDLVGLSIAFWQALLRIDRPRHVILHFIMRERRADFPSRLKYFLLRFLFSSINRAVVSARTEVGYYSRAFRWPDGKAVFIPLFTDPTLLAREATEVDPPYGIAAGRTFRDYDTLIEAISGTDLKLILVGGQGTIQRFGGRSNVEVLEDIPPDQLNSLIAKAAWVAVPLHEREISIGQSVVLQAMALGKPIVATNVPGTSDYLKQDVTGILVPVYDTQAWKDAIERMQSKELRFRLGGNAKDHVKEHGMPNHYASHLIRNLLGS